MINFFKNARRRSLFQSQQFNEIRPGRQPDTKCDYSIASNKTIWNLHVCENTAPIPVIDKSVESVKFVFELCIKKNVPNTQI